MVLEINLLQGEARVQNYWSIAWSCYYVSSSGKSSEDKYVWVSLGKLSSKNKLTAVGCATLATIMGSTSTDADIVHNNGTRFYTSTCASFCGDEDRMTKSAECDGMGCCQTSIPQNLTSYTLAFANSSGVTQNPGAPSILRPYFPHDSKIQRFSPCSYAFVVEENWFKFNASYAISNNFKSQDGQLPLVLDWRVGTETCDEAKKNKASYACAAINSECVPARSGPGYLCNCSQGYTGNPYIGGCDKGQHPYISP
jgi:hypothetical protein